jgi:DNA-binding YbaB/EbfC family protein
MGSGYSKWKKQAKSLEAQVAKAQEEQKEARYSGESGNGLVAVTLNGLKDLVSILIKPDCVDKSDVEGLQDLIKAAWEEASRKADASSGQIGLPF